MSAEFLLKDIKWNTLETGFITGLYHESASTMGIVVETDNAYEKIYDKTYRWMVLNAANFGNRVSRSFMPGNRQQSCSSLLFHVKNTPELSGGVLTQDMVYRVGCLIVMWGKQVQLISLYGRFILTAA